MSDQYSSLHELLYRVAERVDGLPALARDVSHLQREVAVLKSTVARIERARGHGWDFIRMLACAIIGGVATGWILQWVGSI